MYSYQKSRINKKKLLKLRLSQHALLVLTSPGTFGDQCQLITIQFNLKVGIGCRWYRIAYGKDSIGFWWHRVAYANLTIAGIGSELASNLGKIG
jgi:hypothetical protein